MAQPPFTFDEQAPGPERVGDAALGARVVALEAAVAELSARLAVVEPCRKSGSTGGLVWGTAGHLWVEQAGRLRCAQCGVVTR